ncbi:MAG: hypothetical protein ABJB40_07005 [Acidobacteriota bacterium]
MKKIQTALFIAVLGLGVMFISSPTANANVTSANAAAQVVPTTKRVSKKVYRKGRWVTVTTWSHGKRVSKKVWRTGNRWGHKAGRKTKNFVMGPKTRRP